MSSSINSPGDFLTLRGVCKRYGAVAALDDVSLTVRRGSRTAVVGPSGSGKSTLLRILAGFDAPDAGQVRLDGAVLVDGPAIVPAHRRGIGLVAQEGALFPHLSVADNIGFGVPRRTEGRAGWIGELADLVELDRAMLRRMPDALSGGQQQRVALARALACRPRLMLLDEPFSALDTGLRDSTRKAVSDLLGKAGITAILVTHDQAEALTFADQVAVMHEGRLLQAGPPRELYLKPCNEMVARFLGDALILSAELGGGWARCALGRIRVDDARDAAGTGRVMLRLEQLSIAPLDAEEEAKDGAWDRARNDAGNDAGNDAVGVVQRVEFSGASCTVALRLLSASASDVFRPEDVSDHGPALLVVRTAQNATPHEGAMVRVRVAGEAHIL